MLRTHVRPLVLGIAFATAATTGYTQQLEEVVVTATKREQSLSDVPISVSAISGELIQDAAIKSFQELTAYVPNLAITENAVNSIISMRGIGVGANQSFEQSVGVFLDGVHLGKSRQVRLGLFDLEQVEVLRGPQGILFGKNTLAGAINVRSASPILGGEAEGRLAVSKESFNGDIIEGWWQTSLTDDFAIRLAVRDTTSDGHLVNGFASASNGATPTAPTTDETIWRLSAKWQASDATTVDIKYMDSDFRRLGSNAVPSRFDLSILDPDGIPASNLIMYNVMAIAYPGFTTGTSDIYRDSKTLGGNILSGGSVYGGPNERDEGTDTQNEEWSVNIQHEFDNGTTMNYVFGDSYYQYADGIDADFLPVEFIGRADDSTYDQISHELRFTGSFSDDFDWIGGVNYVNGKQKIDRLVTFDGTLGQPGLVSAILSGAYSANPAVSLLQAVDGAVAAATGGTGTSFLTNGVVVPGTRSAFALNPWDLMASITGVTATQIATGLAPLSAWTDTAAGYALATGGRNVLADNYNIDGASMVDVGGRLSYYQQDTDSSSIFFQGTYRFNDAWSVTAGVRYTEETKDAYARTDLTQSSTGIGNVVSPAQAPFNHGFQASSFASWAHEFDEGRKTTQTIPGVTVQWEPDDNNNYYLSYSEGFKSGGFNSVDDQNPAFGLTATGGVDTSNPIRNEPGRGFEYDDETASSWEIGGKHRLMDGRMQFNWAAYASTYENLQVSSYSGLGFIVANAAEATINGAEFDLNYQASEKLRVSVAMGFNDGSYDSFPTAGCSSIQQNAIRALAFNSATGSADNFSDIVGASALGCTQVNAAEAFQDLKGEPLGTDYNGSAQIEYLQPLSGDMMWFTQLDYNFTDGYFLQGDREPRQFQDGYGRFNLRTGLRTENWFLMAYGRNIGDEEVASGGFNIPLAQGSFARYRAPGAIYGFQAAYQF